MDKSHKIVVLNQEQIIHMCTPRWTHDSQLLVIPQHMTITLGHRAVTRTHVKLPNKYGNICVFLKTCCSPGDPPSDLQNVKNNLEPSSPHTSSKMGSKQKKIIRDENVQFTATTCIDILLQS